MRIRWFPRLHRREFSHTRLPQKPAQIITASSALRWRFPIVAMEWRPDHRTVSGRGEAFHPELAPLGEVSGHSLSSAPTVGDAQLSHLGCGQEMAA
jgi:hypothetical protein